MQAQDMPMKMDSHTWGYYREGRHKNSFQFIVRFVEMKADGLDAFLFCFFFRLFLKISRSLNFSLMGHPRAKVKKYVQQFLAQLNFPTFSFACSLHK